LGGGFYRLLETREVVSVTSRMMDFGKQNGNFLKYVSQRIGRRCFKFTH
jgi:hypothetical protein